jgi:dihydrodipicolinate synthase/N-acetylneuraminate lyase
MATIWKGVFPAVIDGGIIVLPMLGENASLNLGEREQVIRVASETLRGSVPLLLGQIGG